MFKNSFWIRLMVFEIRITSLENIASFLKPDDSKNFVPGLPNTEIWKFHIFFYLFIYLLFFFLPSSFRTLFAWIRLIVFKTYVFSVTGDVCWPPRAHVIIFLSRLLSAILLRQEQYARNPPTDIWHVINKNAKLIVRFEFIGKVVFSTRAQENGLFAH